MEFSGNHSTTTRPFTINDKWELQWVSGGSIFQVYLYSEGGKLIDLLVNRREPDSGSAYQPRGGTVLR